MSEKFLTTAQIDALRQVFQYFDVYSSGAFLEEVENCCVCVKTWSKDDDEWDAIEWGEIPPTNEDLEYATLKSSRILAIKDLNLAQTISLLELLVKSEPQEMI